MHAYKYACEHVSMVCMYTSMLVLYACMENLIYMHFLYAWQVWSHVCFGWPFCRYGEGEEKEEIKWLAGYNACVGVV